MQWQWLNSNHNVCPVCKAGVSKDNVIPLYGRGTEQVDPRCAQPSEVPVLITYSISAAYIIKDLHPYNDCPCFAV